VEKYIEVKVDSNLVNKDVDLKKQSLNENVNLTTEKNINDILHAYHVINTNEVNRTKGENIIDKKAILNKSVESCNNSKTNGESKNLFFLNHDQQIPKECPEDNLKPNLGVKIELHTQQSKDQHQNNCEPQEVPPDKDIKENGKLCKNAITSNKESKPEVAKFPAYTNLENYSKIEKMVADKLSNIVSKETKDYKEQIKETILEKKKSYDSYSSENSTNLLRSNMKIYHRNSMPDLSQNELRKHFNIDNHQKIKFENSYTTYLEKTQSPSKYAHSPYKILNTKSQDQISSSNYQYLDSKLAEKEQDYSNDLINKFKEIGDSNIETQNYINVIKKDLNSIMPQKSKDETKQVDYAQGTNGSTNKIKDVEDSSIPTYINKHIKDSEQMIKKGITTSNTSAYKFINNETVFNEEPMYRKESYDLNDEEKDYQSNDNVDNDKIDNDIDSKRKNERKNVKRVKSFISNIYDDVMTRFQGKLNLIGSAENLNGKKTDKGNELNRLKSLSVGCLESKFLSNTGESNYFSDISNKKK